MCFNTHKISNTLMHLTFSQPQPESVKWVWNSFQEKSWPASIQNPIKQQTIKTFHTAQPSGYKGKWKWITQTQTKISIAVEHISHVSASFGKYLLIHLKLKHFQENRRIKSFSIWAYSMRIKSIAGILRDKNGWFITNNILGLFAFFG